MRTLDDLQKLVSGFKDYDFKLFYSVLCEKINTEDDLISKMEICKFIKTTYQYEKNEVFDKIFDLEKQYFKYIENKVNLKYGKKQWQKMIDYLNNLCQYFELDDSNVVFDSFYDYFLYVTMYPENTKDLQFKMGIEGWVHFKYAVAYRNLKKYDLAEQNLLSCINCSPMSFVAYEELFKVFCEQNNYQSLKKYLDISYKIAKTAQDLGSYFYYYSLYAYNSNNFQLAKATCQLALNLDILPAYRNKLIDIFKQIIESKKIISNVFVANPNQVLIQNNVPNWFSYDIMAATIVLYKACLSKVIENKNIQLASRKNLFLYKLKDYVTQIETNLLTRDNMYMFENCGVCVKLNKKWQIRYKVSEDVFAGTLLEAVEGDNTLTIVLDQNKYKYDFKTLCQENLKTLKNANFKIVEPKEIYTIKQKNIYSVIVEQEETKVCMMFVEVKDKLFVVTMNIDVNKDDKIKELYSIVDSLKPFYSINRKFN